MVVVVVGVVEVIVTRVATVLVTVTKVEAIVETWALPMPMTVESTTFVIESRNSPETKTLSELDILAAAALATKTGTLPETKASPGQWHQLTEN